MGRDGTSESGGRPQLLESGSGQSVEELEFMKTTNRIKRIFEETNFISK